MVKVLNITVSCFVTLLLYLCGEFDGARRGGEVVAVMIFILVQARVSIIILNFD